MVGWKNSILVLVLFLVLALVFWINKKENQGNEGKIIKHCMDCKWLTRNGDEAFSREALDSEYLVIVYTRNLTFELATFNMDWKSISEKYPQIDFVFYYGGKSEERILDWMAEKNFSFPVIFDPQDTFRKSNLEGDMTGIVLNTKDKKVVSMMNPSFGEAYEEFLSEMIK